jgi:hypothetical protein
LVNATLLGSGNTLEAGSFDPILCWKLSFFFPFHLSFFLFFFSKKLEVIDPLFSPLALVSQVLENPWHRWISDIHHT